MIYYSRKDNSSNLKLFITIIICIIVTISPWIIIVNAMGNDESGIDESGITYEYHEIEGTIVIPEEDIVIEDNSEDELRNRTISYNNANAGVGRTDENDYIDPSFITAGAADLTDNLYGVTKDDFEELLSVDNLYEFSDLGYTTAILNIRAEPNTDSDILEEIDYNGIIYYSNYNDDWNIVKTKDGKTGYVSKYYVSDSTNPGRYVEVVGDKRKSYEDYKKITLPSMQLKIQNNDECYTAKNGLRMYKDRYLIAVGSYYKARVGQYVDVVLENGNVLPCVVGDAKADRDTNANNSVGGDGSVAEFIVDTSSLSRAVRSSGDVSSLSSRFNSKVVGIKVYDFVAHLH